VLWVIVIALMLVGLAGTVVPFLPGTPLIFLAALIHAIATDWTPIGGGRLTILALLAAAGYAAPHLASAVGARRGGGSRWAVGGALVGGFVGLFLGVPGLLLGPLVGAIIGELLNSGNVVASIETGVATFVGLIAGAVANIALAVTMIGLFLLWVALG
jgi:uncharacterized protein YqgC (DUF456 family)